MDLTLDQKRELSYKRTKRLFEYDFLPNAEFMENPMKLYVFSRSIHMYDTSVYSCFNLSRRVSGRGQRDTVICVYVHVYCS